VLKIPVLERPKMISETTKKTIKMEKELFLFCITNIVDFLTLRGKFRVIF